MTRQSKSLSLLRSILNQPTDTEPYIQKITKVKLYSILQFTFFVHEFPRSFNSLHICLHYRSHPAIILGNRYNVSTHNLCRTFLTQDKPSVYLHMLCTSVIARTNRDFPRINYTHSVVNHVTVHFNQNMYICVGIVHQFL